MGFSESMKRREADATPVRVYSYGCKAPITNANLVEEQFWLASRQYNDLIASERIRRDDIREVQATVPELGAMMTALEEAVQSLDAARDAVKAVKASGGKASTEQKALAAEIKSRIKSIRQQIKDYKDAHKDELRALYTEIDAAAKSRKKTIRASAGTRHGTYTRVEEAVMQASSSSKRPPKFHRYDGSGCIGTQITEPPKTVRSTEGGPKGLTVTELYACKDTRLQIVPLQEGWEGLGRHHRRKTHRTVVRLRVGSENRQPVWAEFPLFLHRPLPADAIIKWAYIVRKRVGRKYQWSLQLTIESETFRARASSAETGTAIGVDLGWRGGRRVAYVADLEGGGAEIAVPERTTEGAQKVEDLRGIRDKNFEFVRDALVAHLRGRSALPEWLEDMRRHMHQWRAPRRLVALINRDSKEPCGALDDIREKLRAWAKQDRHLLDWESAQREGGLAHRREYYRKVAAHIAQRYETIVIEDREDMDLTKFGTMKAPEDGDPSEYRKYRRNLRAASPGMFREILLKATSKYGAHVIDNKAAYTTRTCNNCGYAKKWENPSECEHRCASCGTVFDRDLNAARNLLCFAGLAELGQFQGPSEVLDLPQDRARVRHSPDTKQNRKLARRRLRGVLENAA